MNKVAVVAGSTLFLGLSAIAAVTFHAEYDTWFPLESQVAATITRDDPGCDANSPIGVTLTNNSRRTITRTELILAVFRVGHSSTLESQTTDTDKIIQPGEQFSLCLAKPGKAMAELMPNNPYTTYSEDQLEYRIQVYRVEAE